MSSLSRRFSLLALFVLALSAPASAAPVQTGTVSGASPTFTWKGGPLSGANLVGEPCNTSHQCEDILLHVGDAGNLKIKWKASAPDDQDWLGFTLYEADAQGNPQGDPVADTGAFASEGALSADVQAKDYVVEVSAVAATAATYDATATLDAGAEPTAEYGEKPKDASAHDWYTLAGAEWRQAYIDEADGTRLHVDILRPAGTPADAKTPVILSIGPYFNHTGQTGPAGPAEKTSYDPLATPGPSNRFADFVLGADVIRKGYSFVMVDLRGFGGSSGCLDWGGPGEQADVKAAVEWAASQPWSTGHVGMYGKSYDGVTGLIGEVLSPKGLGAVVAQEPVYDLYRYLYAEGIRYENSAATPALYDAIEATPGSVFEPDYVVNGSNTTARPGCEAQNYADQQDPNHDSDYWKARNLIPLAKNGHTPLFMTQGFLENNTKPDGTWDFFNSVDAPKRAWFGMWDHVRGNDVNGQGRLVMGRKGWFDEVMRWYDKWLRDIEPTVADPTLAIQTSDGTWRAEDQWPPPDSKSVTVKLKDGKYTDDAQNKGTNDGLAATSNTGVGVWTISPKLDYEVHLAGVPRVKLAVESSAPNANLAAAVYDIDADRKALLLHRQARLIPENGTYAFDLYGNDWRVMPGHRIGVLISTAHAEWWQAAQPTNATVSVKNATLELPALTYTRPEHISGKSAVRLEEYTANAPFELPEDTVKSATVSSFGLPAQMSARPGDTREPGTTDPGTTTPKPTTKKRRIRARLLKRRHGRRLVVRGWAPLKSRVTVRLRRGGKTIRLRHVRVRKGGGFVVRFHRHHSRRFHRGRYRAIVKTRSHGQKLRARTKYVRVRR